METTGERLVPDEQHGQVVHAEHLVRYLVASQLAPGRRVLDAACGEGYGTALLAAAGASAATGVDVDDATIAHARSRYTAAEFETADVRELPFDDASFDLVVCFETIEHVPDPERVLAELRRIMAPEGLLVISTPNKHRYLVENEFHEREFPHEEFVALLEERFEHVEILLQHNWLTSAVFGSAPAAEVSGSDPIDVELRKVAALAPGAELYTFALCGSEALPALRPAGVMAGLDEAHELARRLVEAERTAEHWHQRLVDTHSSVWWQMTEPLRRVVQFVRRRRG